MPIFLDFNLTKCLFGAGSSINSIHSFVPLLLIVFPHSVTGMWHLLPVWQSFFVGNESRCMVTVITYTWYLYAVVLVPVLAQVR